MAAMENSRMKLSYFDARGVAETTRYVLAVSKTPYEDFRYPITFRTPGDFSTIVRTEFNAALAAGKLDANLGRLPHLEVDGQLIGQSKTIERFVAKRVGMMGATPVEEAQIDCMCEHIKDCKGMYMKAKTSDETKSERAAASLDT
jgi:glutathione S-transferase